MAAAAELGGTAIDNFPVICDKSIVIIKCIQEPALQSLAGGKEELWTVYVNEKCLREQMVDAFGSTRVLNFKGDLQSVGKLTA